MTAAAGLRGCADASVWDARLQPALQSPSLSSIWATGTVSKAGYCFRVYLPGRDGGFAVGSLPGSPMTGPVDTDGAEKDWWGIAWPVACGNSGKRAFPVDAGGTVYEAGNDKAHYSGRGNPPDPGDVVSTIRARAAARDSWGETWRPQ